MYINRYNMKYIKPLNEARPVFQDTPNEFAYLDFKKWAYKNRGKIKKELSGITDGTKLFMALRQVWMNWATRMLKNGVIFMLLMLQEKILVEL